MSAGGRIGWIGLDAPVEIIAAAGGRPVRLDPDPAVPAGLALAYAEGGGHPWIRAAVERVVREGAGLDGLVIGSTPVLGVWLYNFLLTLGALEDAPPLPALHLCNLSHLERPSAAAFNAAGLRALAGRLGAGAPELSRTIVARNEVRGLQRRIEARRRGPGPRLLGSHARRLLDAADVMDIGAYRSLVEGELAGPVSPPAQDLVPIVLSGPGSPSLELYRQLEAAGLVVVADDLEFGTRAIGPDVGAGEPFAALAERYGRRAPAPSGWATAVRAEWLLELVRDRGAIGVLFDLPPWAHSAAWELPSLERALANAGVRACICAPGASPAQAASAAARAFRSPQPAARHG